MIIGDTIVIEQEISSIYSIWLFAASNFSMINHSLPPISDSVFRSHVSNVLSGKKYYLLGFQKSMGLRASVITSWREG